MGALTEMRRDQLRQEFERVEQVLECLDALLAKGRSGIVHRFSSANRSSSMLPSLAPTHRVAMDGCPVRSTFRRAPGFSFAEKEYLSVSMPAQ